MTDAAYIDAHIWKELDDYWDRETPCNGEDDCECPVCEEKRADEYYNCQAQNDLENERINRGDA